MTDVNAFSFERSENYSSGIFSQKLVENTAIDVSDL